MPKSIRYQLAGMGLLYMLLMAWLHISAMDYYLNEAGPRLFGEDAHTFWYWVCDDLLEDLHATHSGRSGQYMLSAYFFHYLPGGAVMFGAFVAIAFNRVYLTRGFLALAAVVGLFSMSSPWLLLVLCMFCASLSSDGFWWS